MADVFKRLAKGRPPRVERAENVDPIAQPSAQKFIDWLQRGWGKPTICARDICIYGPRPRDRKSVIDKAELLVKHGWLVPLKTYRYSGREWLVVANVARNNRAAQTD